MREGHACPSADLVALFQAGDRTAFAALYEQHAKEVTRQLSGMLRNADDVDDVVQIVFLKVFRGLETYRQGETSLSHWISRIARNAALDHCRVSRRLEPTAPDELEAWIDAASAALEIDDHEWGGGAVHEALDDLCLAHQRVLFCSYAGELSDSEIALLLRRSEQATTRLRERAVIALRKRLVDATDER
jgi:RNA polymerase sigma-70 factor (ECF subfamily)